MASCPRFLQPLLLCALPLLAAENVPDGARQPAHTLLIPYATRMEAQSPKHVTSFARSLEGDWQAAAAGSYRRAFELPSAWAGRRVFARFDGVAAGISVSVNGKAVGRAAAREFAEFDLTDAVHPGQNTLAVDPTEAAAGPETRPVGEIFRSAVLWSAPEVHIRDLVVRSEPDAECRDGLLVVTARVRNYSGRPAPARSLVVELAARGSRIVASETVTVQVLEPGAETAVSLALPVVHPARWSAEVPEIYTAFVSLGGGPRKGASEVLAVSTGFRRVEFRGAAVFVNDREIALKTSAAREVESLKLANANFVRARASEDVRWYDQADRYGLYVAMDPAEPDYALFRNHPSVIAWPADGKETPPEAECGARRLGCQFVMFEAEDVAAGKIRIRNGYAFLNLGKLAASWSITRDGDRIAGGSLPKVDVAPGETGTVRVPAPRYTAKPGSEYRLRISFALAKNESWGKAGQEVAAGEFPLPGR